MDKIDEKVKKAICASIDQQRPTNEMYVKNTEFMYNKTLTVEDMSLLKTHGRDTFGFNITKPFVLKSLKDLRDGGISTTYKPNLTDDEYREIFEQKDPKGYQLTQITDFANKKYEKIQQRCNFDGLVYQAGMDVFVGGKSVIKIKTDYVNKYNFKQDFFISRCLNPTRIFFDYHAKHITKKDSEYCFEIVNLSKNEFEDKYPEVEFDRIENSEYADHIPVIKDSKDGEKTVNVLNYYYKKITHKTLYLYRDKTVSEELKKNKTLIKKRRVEQTKIYYCPIVGELKLKPESETAFRSLPYILVAGERYFDKNNVEHFNAFAKHAYDAQRTKNIIMNYYLYEAFNNQTGAWTLPEECMSDAVIKALKDPSMKNIVVYKAMHTSPDQQTVILKPERFNTNQLPDSYLEIFNGLDKTIEASLGMNMSSIDYKNMSGKALYNLTQFMSASNEIFLTNIAAAVEQVATVILEAMPVLLSNELFTSKDDNNEDVSQEFDFTFEQEALDIVVSKGVDNKLQKQATLEMLGELAKENEIFGRFLNTPPAVEFILSNLDLNEKDKLMEAWEKFSEELQKQQQQQNPEQQMQQEQMQIEQLNAKAKMTAAQAKEDEIRLKEMELGINQKNSDHDRDVEMHKIQSANTRNTLDNVSKMSQTQMEAKKHLIDHLGKQHEER